MTTRYKPTGTINHVKTRGDFFWWGPWPDGYDVRIEVRDVRDDRGVTWHDGCHKVVIDGPQPRPRSKTFIGESAWSAAERYAGDAIAQIQRSS